MFKFYLHIQYCTVLPNRNYRLVLSCNFESCADVFVLHRYDRRKYRDEPDFDDRSMENNRYSSIMQEEMRSAKIGQFTFMSVNETFC
jgi:hypothetical protein